MTRIEEYGWRGAVEPGIGRVVCAHGDYLRLVCNECPGGEITARTKKSVFTRMKTRPPENMKGLKGSQLQLTMPPQPTTGDFVRFRYNAAGDSMITEVLPRFSHFERKDPAARRKVQTLAVNFDALFVMMSLNEDFSTARIRRYLDLAVDLGRAEAVVAVSKIDLRREGDEELFEELEREVAGAARIIRFSVVSGEGMDDVAAYVRPRSTLALIGSSGVGKSTLVNRLAGGERRATREIQEWSGKGRHTTTNRELIMLPSGAMVVDTPGVREIGMPGEKEKELVKGESTHRYRK
ncbi:MAG: GTPase RsgA [Kiritimatiellae bacterium]|nr:GTPase RsgA [Kiritimatiellia bacterium]